MRLPLCILLLLPLLLVGKIVDAQSFVNGDLNGVVNFVSIPTGWTQIPFGDPALQAGPNAIQATPDMADLNGPSIPQGVAGVAQSGTTFSTGLHSSIQVATLITTWHEGIMQTVSGFAVGATYEVSLYQTVVKQTNCLDQSGSWRVYLDTLLIATTTPTVSTLAYNDLNLQWENRIVSFVATSTTHTIKFVPWDDDPNLEASDIDTTGGLRMGIDNISFILPNPDPPVFDLGSDTLLCAGDILILDATSPNSTYLWHDNSTNPTFTVTQAGTYWVDVSNPFGTTRDSIIVDYESFPTVSIDDYVIPCPANPVVLIPNSSPSVLFSWQDGSTDSTYTVSEIGEYTVTVSNYCGTDSGTAIVSAEACEFLLEMPNVFSPNGDNTNESFVPVASIGIETYELLIFNRWGDIVFESQDIHQGWDGKSKAKRCSAGVYFWKVNVIDFNGEDHELHGFVHLID